MALKLEVGEGDSLRLVVDNDEGAEPLSLDVKRIVRFAAISDDTYPSTDLVDAEIGFYESNGTQQLADDVPINTLGHIYLPKRAGDFGTDIASPGVAVNTQDVYKLGNNLVNNEGSSCILVVNRRGSTETAIIQADSIVAYGTEGYSLSSLKFAGDNFTYRQGFVYNVVASITTGVLASDVLDWAEATKNFITRAMVEGTDDDWFSGWSSGILEAGVLDKRYAWNVSSGDGSSAPVELESYNAITDIQAGQRTLIFGETQFAKIPNNDPNSPNAPDKVLTSDDLDELIHAANTGGDGGSNYLTFSNPGAATKVGAGNDAYWWLPVTVTITGAPDEDLAGDVFRFGTELPSDLQMNLDWRVIGNPPWPRSSGRKANEDLEASDDVLIQIGGQWWNVSIGDLVGWHDEHHTGLASLPGFTWDTLNTDSVGDILVTPSGTSDLVTINPLSAAIKKLIKAKVADGRKVQFWKDADNYAYSTVNSGHPGEVFGKVFFNTTPLVTVGALNDQDDIQFRFEANIPTRDEIAAQGYLESSPNIAGKGGSPRDMYQRGSTETDADWGPGPFRTPIDDTDDLTLTRDDHNRNVVRSTNTAAATHTLWDDPQEDDWLIETNSGTHPLTITGNGTDTVDGNANIKVRPGQTVLLVRDTSTAWITLFKTGGGMGIFDNIVTALPDTAADGEIYALRQETLSPFDAGFNLPSGVDNPRGLGITPSGDVLLVDQELNDKIYTYDVSEGTWDAGIAKPSEATATTGIAADAAGNIYIVDHATDKYYKRDITTGTWDAGTAVPTSGNSNIQIVPTGIAVAPNGDLLILEGGGAVTDKIFRKASGASNWDTGLDVPSGATTPTGIFAPTDTEILLVNKNDASSAYYRYDGTSWSHAISLPTPVTFPAGIAEGPLGTIYVADATTDKIYRSHVGETLSYYIRIEGNWRRLKIDLEV